MISVIIANWLNPPLLAQSLKAVKESFLPGTDYEIIVIDIESTPETRYVAQEFEDIKFKAFADNIGYSKAVNEGFKMAEGEYIISLNSDIVPQKGSIEKLVAKLKEEPSIGLIGPQLLNFDGTPQVSRFRFYNPLTVLYRRGLLPFGKKDQMKFLMSEIPLSQSTDADWLMGSAYMTTREALDKVGGHDERLFVYFSDVDWAKRFWENGYRVHFFTESVMWHYHHRASKGKAGPFDFFLIPEARIHTRDGIKFFKKNGFRIKSRV